MRRIISVMTMSLLATVAHAGAGTPDFKIVQITQWVNGQIKIYTDQPSVNGLEGCTATDASIALPADSPGTDRILAVALAGKAAGATMFGYVVGCCLTQHGNQSPCIHTLTIK